MTFLSGIRSLLLPVETVNSAQTLKANGKDLIIECMDRDPLKRPTCAELLAHPFLVNADGAGDDGLPSFDRSTSVVGPLSPGYGSVFDRNLNPRGGIELSRRCLHRQTLPCV
jgi:serine/threonine protein kinase